jgi:hypothetical protein
MDLNDWKNEGWLKPHQPHARDIGELLAIADRDLKDSTVRGLSPDSRLKLAFNAALQAATAALAAAGYRAVHETRHYRIMQSLACTINAAPDFIIQMDGFRKKRNISEYEQAGAVSIQESQEVQTLAKWLRCEVERWLRETHPELLNTRAARFKRTSSG